MATHSKKVDPSLGGGTHQVFTNDTSVTGAVTFATGDYIDFMASLGRPATKLLIYLNGDVDITIGLNTLLVRNTIDADYLNATISMTEGVGNTNPFRLFGSSGGFLSWELPLGIPIKNLKIVAYSGVASSTVNVTFMAF